MMWQSHIFIHVFACITNPNQVVYVHKAHLFAYIYARSLSIHSPSGENILLSLFICLLSLLWWIRSDPWIRLDHFLADAIALIPESIISLLWWFQEKLSGGRPQTGSDTLLKGEIFRLIPAMFAKISQIVNCYKQFLFFIFSTFHKE